MDTDAHAARTEAGQCARYLRTDDTFAVLIAAAAPLSPSRDDRTHLVANRASALAPAEFVVAAAQRAGVLRELVNQLDKTAVMVRASRICRSVQATVMSEAHVF